MTSSRNAPVLAAIALFVLCSASTGASRAAETPPAAEPGTGPETFSGLTLVVNGPSNAMVTFRIMVERWSTAEERKALAETLRSKGQDALVSALDDLNMGRIQFSNNIARPIRIASTWQTSEGRKVRLATNRQMTFDELTSSARSKDYPFGILEFTLPAEGKGTGTLLGAVKARFDAEGRLEVESLPLNTGPQQLTEIVREVPKAKKSKKKS